MLSQPREHSTPHNIETKFQLPTYQITHYIKYKPIAPILHIQRLAPVLLFTLRSLHLCPYLIYKILHMSQHVLFQAFQSLIRKRLAHDPPLPRVMRLLSRK